MELKICKNVQLPKKRGKNAVWKDIPSTSRGVLGLGMQQLSGSCCQRKQREQGLQPHPDLGDVTEPQRLEKTFRISNSILLGWFILGKLGIHLLLLFLLLEVKLGPSKPTVNYSFFKPEGFK